MSEIHTCHNCGETDNHRFVTVDRIEHIITEQEILCGKCDELVGYWAYGYFEWFDKNEKLKPKCYCGKPVDVNNPDCVEFNLCEEHADDA